jgi:hypothetical protein
VLKRLTVRYRHLHEELALIDAELDAILTLHARHFWILTSSIYRY